MEDTPLIQTDTQLIKDLFYKSKLESRIQQYALLPIFLPLPILVLEEKALQIEEDGKLEL